MNAWRAAAVVFLTGGLIFVCSERDEALRPLIVDPRASSSLLAIFSEATRCTAVRLPNDWILSAEHCNRGKDLQVCEVHSGQCSAAKAIHGHPRLDVALFRAHPPLPHPEDHMTWFPARPLEVGDQLQLFGVGKRGEQAPQPSSPINVEVQGIRGDLTKVRSLASPNPCWGDSGAPLIGNDSGGKPYVRAILVAGSPSCKGVDGVLPIAVIESWMKEMMAKPLP